MVTDKMIHDIARQIAREYPLRLILGECADLIGEDRSVAGGYYEIEDCIGDEMGVHVTVTPEVKTHYEGGYVGCDLMDCDCVIDDVVGVEDCEVLLLDIGGEQFDDKDKGRLREELLRVWR